MSIHIGTSGWSYDHWQGILYPYPTPVHDRLSYYVQHFETVELNSSFYRWPRQATFTSWRERLPESFQLSVKAPRGLTHAKKLYAPETWMERIRACWHQLQHKRAVLLVQLMPAFLRLRPAGVLSGAGSSLDASSGRVPTSQLAQRSHFSTA